MGAIGERSRGQVAAYVAAVVLVIVAGFRYLGGGAEEPPAPALAVDESAGGEREAGDAHDGHLYVHVAGAVREAGLYRLEAGSRVGAAIDRAGGVREAADLSGVNLAAELQDGQQVLVPRRGSAPSLAATGSPSTASGSPSTAGSPAAPISLAQATPEQLDAGVDGIGPTLAARIIEFREEQGGVSSIDELREVDGIGEERLAALREALVP